MRKIITGITLFILVSCQSDYQDEPLHSIPTITVEQGNSIGVDLSVYFTSKIKSIDVPGHPFLDVTYDAHNDSLVITPKPHAPRLSKIPLVVNGREQEILVRIQPLIEYTFTYKPQPGEKHVIVMGGFNDWSRTALPMEDKDNDGVFERSVYLKPVRHEYKFVIDGEEKIDPENPVFISNNIGGWNSILDLSDRKESAAGKYVKRTYSGGKVRFDFIPSEDGTVPVFPYVYFNNAAVHNDAFDLLPDGGLTVNLRKLKNGTLRITGLDEEGRVIDDNITLIRNGKPLSPESHSDNWYFTVLYSLMTDRFLDGNPANTVKVINPELKEIANWHGGDFAGIIQKLQEGYFSNLGINAIWLSPVQRQPEQGWKESIPPYRTYAGYHGYWPIAPREIDPRFGTEEELKQLVNLAHAKGLRVILDFVSNHVHEEHPYFKDHREWFGQVELPDGSLNIRNWSEETRLTTWFDTFIPSYDYLAAPEAVDQVVDDALWWMETFNFDGFRQDAVKHVPHIFWKKLTAGIKEKFPMKNVYQIGETFGSDALIASYVNPGELSAQFNFSIYFNARVPFANDEADFSHLATVLEDNAIAFGPVNLMGNITSSHDQMKFMAVADGQVGWGDNGTELAFTNPPKTSENEQTYSKLANFYAFNISIPGIPVVYYGEEIGLMGAADPDNRRPMKFGNDVNAFGQNLQITFSALNKLRQEYPALAIGDYIPVYQKGPVWVFEKRYFNERILVAFNHSANSTIIDLELDENPSVAINLLDEAKQEIGNGRLSFIAVPYSHTFFALE